MNQRTPPPFNTPSPPAQTQIEVVRTLQEFRRHSADHRPDLALLDLNLPDGKAVEVLTNPPENGAFSHCRDDELWQRATGGASHQVGRAGLCREIAGILRRNAAHRRPRPARVDPAPGAPEAVAAQKKLIAELEAALSKVKTLSGLLPICSGCNKIRDDKGYWSQVEGYIQEHTDAQFTHGLCPDCIRKIFSGNGRNQDG